MERRQVHLHSSLFPFTRNKRQPRNRSINHSLTLKENNNICWQEAWSPGTAVVEVLLMGGLTQKMMLNPKIKYLMQQLTSWALKCFPDIIWLDFRFERRHLEKESHPRCFRGEKVLKWSVRSSTKRRRQRSFGCLLQIIAFPLTSDGTFRWTRRAATAPPPSRHFPTENFQQMEGEASAQKAGWLTPTYRYPNDPNHYWDCNVIWLALGEANKMKDWSKEAGLLVSDRVTPQTAK